MTAEEIKKVTDKLIGKIDPVGETRTDEKRLENLKTACKLVELILVDIDEIEYDYKDRPEFSMKRAGEYASVFNDKLEQSLKDR